MKIKNSPKIPKAECRKLVISRTQAFSRKQRAAQIKKPNKDYLNNLKTKILRERMNDFLVNYVKFWRKK